MCLMCLGDKGLSREVTSFKSITLAAEYRLWGQRWKQLGAKLNNSGER